MYCAPLCHVQSEACVYCTSFGHLALVCFACKQHGHVNVVDGDRQHQVAMMPCGFEPDPECCLFLMRPSWLSCLCALLASCMDRSGDWMVMLSSQDTARAVPCCLGYTQL